MRRRPGNRNHRFPPHRAKAHAVNLGLMAEQSRSTAELIVECLENEGVTHVFGIPGEENIHLVEALSKSSIRYVLVRHEQGASFMAEVYGRLTGRAGVCSATLGPGAINLLLGVADATTNSTPLIALSAQVGMNRSYKESHQSVDLVSMFAPVTKWSALIATPDAVPEMIRKAFKLAQTERPGAVYLAVPEDVEKAAGAGGAHAAARSTCRARTSRRRASWRGPRRSCAPPATRSCSPATVPRGPVRARRCSGSPRRSDIPVATTFHGKGVFPDDHPLALGAVGFMRHDYVNFGFDQADVDRRRRLRAAGVRPGPDQPERRQEDHPHPPLPGRGRRPLRGRGRAAIRHQPHARRARGRRRAQASVRRRRADPGAPGGRARARPAGRPLPARPGADRGRHPRRARPRGHRARGHRRAEDVDGPAVPDLRAEHLPDLQRPVDDGVDPARRDRRQDRPAGREGARRDRRRRVPDELAGDRDRAQARGFRSSS